MAKTPKADKRKLILEKRFRRSLLLIPLIALFIKILIIFRIQGFDWYQAGNGDLSRGLGELLDKNYIPPNSWFGADGENYIKGLKGLIEEGVLSKNENLLYWPAGYPLIIWPLIELFRGYFFLALSICQSVLYALASAWFVDEVRRTRVKKVSYLLAIILAINPTLTLGTLTVGYELSVVSLSLISIASLLRYFLEKKEGLFQIEIFIAAFSWSCAVFLQPRLWIIALIFFILWASASFRLRMAFTFLILTISFVSIAPAFLVVRNNVVHSLPTISTNLGITMRLGAGPETSGGYSKAPTGLVDCPSSAGNPIDIDRGLVKCVVKWYLENPRKTLILFANKAKFFWSPWFGPEANGTMGRNPWNKIHPLKSVSQTMNGSELIYGIVGKSVSWLWMLAALALLMYGLRSLWKLGDIEKLLAIIAISIFLANLISAMLTIGDHRFRVPSMGVSLFLQVVGLAELFFRRNFVMGSQTNLVGWRLFKGELVT